MIQVCFFVLGGENMLLKKVYKVSSKGKDDTPRLFLQHLVCEAACFVPGEKLSVTERGDQIIISELKDTNTNQISVSSRKNQSTGKRRPLVDTAKESYKKIIQVSEKVEVCVYHKKVIVRPLRFNLMNVQTLPKKTDERISLLSVCAGGGIGTAAFVDTQYFTPTAEIELEDDCVEVLRHNFGDRSFVFNGDIRDINEIPKSDVMNITLPCNKWTQIGSMTEGLHTDLAIAAARIIRASAPEMLFFENVPRFFSSNIFRDLKNLVKDIFPYWSEKNIDAVDFGSIAKRNRTYAVAFRSEEAFLNFEFPSPPRTVKRSKLREYLDGKNIIHQWKDLRTWMDSFQSRSAFKDRNLTKTFVTPDAKEIQCILGRYRSHCSSNSYLLNEDKTKWRFFSINELKRILSIPQSFSFPDTIPLTRRYEIIGQSVDCRIIKVIANQIAKTFYKIKTLYREKKKNISNLCKEHIPISVEENGQLTLI